jgi:quercetin dioxygenase-like cupin family protein
MQQASGIKRTDFQQHDLGIPAREVVQNGVNVSLQGTAFEHEHPGEEVVYVFEGSLEYQVEGEPLTMLNTVEVLFVPTGTIPAVKNVDTGKAAELATHVFEKGNLLLVLVE